MYLPVGTSLFTFELMHWKNREIEKELNTGHAKPSRVARFWLSKSDHTPNEYYDMKDTVAQPKETGSSPKRIEVKTKTLRETLEYAAKFQTDDGMTAYLKRAVTVLPEEDRGTVENLLNLSDQQIRAEIKRISA